MKGETNEVKKEAILIKEDRLEYDEVKNILYDGTTIVGCKEDIIVLVIRKGFHT